MIRCVSIILFLIVQWSWTQQTDCVDFKTAKATIFFGNLIANEVEGTITYEFEILKNTDSIFIDANNFSNIEYVLDENISGNLYNGKQLIIEHPFKANTKHNLHVLWKTTPKKSMYFIDWNFEDGNKQIWTQGQGKYTSNWLPSIDDMNEKIVFDVTITFNKDYEVIANGKLANKQRNDSTMTWHYQMKQPMSSYLVALAIGNYNKRVAYSKRSIPLEMYYYPEDSLNFEPTYRYTKQIFDFLENEIGVPYPWQNYKQVPVKNFLYAGMENTSTTIFSDAFVIDSIAFVDKNYVNVNAHELAHQWFGNLITETSGTHHWLHEGFATYYALLAEKEVFGDEYYYWRLYEYAQELLEQDKAGLNTSLLDPKSSSTTFYKKGAWVLHILREKVGEKVFKEAVKNYLNKHSFKNVETNDFISEVENSCGENLNDFVENWIKNKTFKYKEAEMSLKKSMCIQAYLNIDYEVFKLKHRNYLSSNISEEAKTKIIFQLPKLIKKKVFNTSLKVRQAIAQNLKEIPPGLKKNYESLLEDASYVTKETALYNLWNNFPQERIKYLNKTKGIQGFNDKNIRILWLTLALVTEDFEPENKALYFDELTNYTSPKFSFEIRQNAFQYLNLIQACHAYCKENLEQATKHHNWQFSKFAKDLLKEN